MTIVSGTDHWLFISSIGGHCAGRINAEHILFLYYTEEKLTDSFENMGVKTIFALRTATRHSFGGHFQFGRMDNTALSASCIRISPEQCWFLTAVCSCEISTKSFCYFFGFTTPGTFFLTCCHSETGISQWKRYQSQSPWLRRSRFLLYQSRCKKMSDTSICSLLVYLSFNYSSLYINFHHSINCKIKLITKLRRYSEVLRWTFSKVQ